MDWSHLWLLENGNPNKIKVNRERYLKFMVTDLNDPNEPFTASANSPKIQGWTHFLAISWLKLLPLLTPNNIMKL